MDNRVTVTAVDIGQSITVSQESVKQEITIGENSNKLEDHALLANRDAPNQHPISAITDLDEKLNACANGEAITNLEIDMIWNTAAGG